MGILIGLDPGKLTGFTAVNYQDHSLKLLSHKELKTYEEINEILKYAATTNSIVVVESYRANISTVNQLDACFKVGFITGCLTIRNVEFYLQMPSVRKGYIALAREFLKKQGCKSKHCIDSAAHILRHIDKQGGLGNVRF
jgi:gamma-glutamylcyclotransferase (GGCT)/AIG2-like uncharacterized protein YtfP